MEWLKKLCSRNIRFTPEIETEAREIAKWITKYYLSGATNLEEGGVEIVNPYSQDKKKKFHSLAILSESKNILGGGVYDYRKGNINFYPYTIFPKGSTKDYNKIYTTFLGYVQHELTHLLDPKLKYEQFRVQPNASKHDYYTNITEFDAYSKQAVEDIRRQIANNPNTKNQIIQWLRRNNVKPIPAFLNVCYTPIIYWEEFDRQTQSDYIKKFKQRIYQELFNENLPGDPYVAQN